MKKGKLIHLSQDCIYNLTVLAANKKTNFKQLVEGILENEGKKHAYQAFEAITGLKKRL